MGVLDNAEYTQETVQLNQGDILILYTDGITEAENAKQEMFDLERLEKVILASHNLPAKEMSTEILNAVREFCGEYPQSDDITLMIIRSL